MKLILFSGMLLFALSAAADNGKTQAPDDHQAATQTDKPHINAKSLYDGNDYDGGTADDGGGQKVAPARAPAGSSGDLPYSDEEMHQADPNNFSPSNKNMPVDQD